MRESSDQRAARLAAELSAAPSISESQYRKVSRRALLTGTAGTLAGFGGWSWVQHQGEENRIPGVLRDVQDINEGIWRKLFREGHQARTFPRSEASILRINGRHGLESDLDLDRWQLRVEGPDGEELGRHTLADIQALPKHEMVIEHKCIEGWSQVTHWAGARFRDFAAVYDGRVPADTKYVALWTPDRRYYVSMDMATMMHDQTLLAYESLDAPLDTLHGAPLRLATPLKYGIKQIKRIGSIRFSNERPDDYWGERGYDWYAGL